MALIKSLFPVLSSLLLLAGCAVDTTDSDLGDRSAEAPDYVVTQVREDGMFVQEVDADLTECADGSLQPRCFVASADLSEASRSPEHRALLDREFAAGHAILEGELIDETFIADPVESPAASYDLTTRDEHEAGWPTPTPIGQACGSVVCDPGLSCCNASCGWCVPPGVSCIQIACDSES